jgi:hypothetical protein
LLRNSARLRYGCSGPSFDFCVADAFAAALAKERKTELVTGDPEFKALEKEIKINGLK